MYSRRLLIVAVIAVFSSAAQAQTTWYVDDDNCPGPGSGTQADPFCSIQDAIDAAVDTDEIVVAPGTYVETINFLGKAVTLRSSDGPEVTAIGGPAGSPVVTCQSGEGPNTVLDGFTVAGGNNPDGFGGGMFNNGASPTVTNCVFLGNSAGGGGGMYNTGSPTVTNCSFLANVAAGGGGGMYNTGSPTVTNCTFSGNTGYGGGMYNSYGNPTVTNCTFLGNTGGGIRSYQGSVTVTDSTFTGNIGDGMLNDGVNATVINCTFVDNLGHGMWNKPQFGVWTVTNCIFIGNSGPARGGGMLNGDKSGNPVNATVTNCIFIGNSAGCGGAMYNWYSSPTVANCIFIGNTANEGGGMFNEYGTPTVTNCILWGNNGGQVSGFIAALTYSDVEGGLPGVGNIDADPMFVLNPDPGPDREWGTEDDDYGDLHLLPGSPCIDAGNNWGVPPDTADLDSDNDTSELTPLDLDGNPRFADDLGTSDTGCGVPVVVDMGTYEFEGNSVNPVYLGDIGGDGVVGIVDFLLLLAAWGPCQQDCCLADLDLDGNVGITDFLILLEHWG